jgi:hypothetical protein
MHSQIILMNFSYSLLSRIPKHFPTPATVVFGRFIYKDKRMHFFWSRLFRMNVQIVVRVLNKPYGMK